jgi:hypothetical protein
MLASLFTRSFSVPGLVICLLFFTTGQLAAESAAAGAQQAGEAECCTKTVSSTNGLTRMHSKN